MSGFYITTPIYYVNGSPHIGHAYTTTAADVAARWNRNLGRPVRFLTGTDEHGQKVMEAAAARNMTPKEHCDDIVVSWKAMMKAIDIQYDRFIRTTDADHEAVVAAVLTDLHERDEVYKDTYTGWYLVKDEVFITEKEKDERIASGELQPEHFRELEETNWFFRMSKYRDPLVAHIEANPGFIQPESRRNEVLGFLRKDLGDLCISRPKARMSWGIELPFDKDFVTYVWFDALLNYLTGTGYHPDTPDSDWETWWPASFQLIGKDILTTHSVYWTTMLLAMGVPLPKSIYAHGWWLANGKKIGKSEGNSIDVDLLVEAYGLDSVRFFFLMEAKFGADGGFTYEGFQTSINNHLSNDLGNLVHRALTMTTKWLGPEVPDREAPNAELRALAEASFQTAMEAMDNLQFDVALGAVMELVGAGNKFIEQSKPWDLNKSGDKAGLGAVLRDVLEIAFFAASMLLAVLPNKAPELLEKLGSTREDALAMLQTLQADPTRALDVLRPGQTLTLGEPLFPRHREFPPAVAARLAPPEPEGPAELPDDIDWIEFPDFQKVLLKTGEVVSAEVHPKADKLLVLEVEVGEARPRTICAGIKSRFAPTDLVGRKVVVVANLKPRTMRGIASEGMILAAGDKEVIDLLGVEAPAGTIVR